MWTVFILVLFANDASGIGQQVGKTDFRFTTQADCKTFVAGREAAHKKLMEANGSRESVVIDGERYTILSSVLACVHDQSGEPA